MVFHRLVTHSGRRLNSRQRTNRNFATTSTLPDWRRLLYAQDRPFGLTQTEEDDNDKIGDKLVLQSTNKDTDDHVRLALERRILSVSWDEDAADG